jgi:hypothetical protein
VKPTAGFTLNKVISPFPKQKRAPDLDALSCYSICS